MKTETVVIENVPAGYDVRRAYANRHGVVSWLANPQTDRQMIQQGHQRFGPYKRVKNIQVTNSGNASFVAEREKGKGDSRAVICVDGKTFALGSIRNSDFAFYNRGSVATFLRKRYSQRMFVVIDGKEMGPFMYQEEVQWHPEAGLLFHARQRRRDGKTTNRFVFQNGTRLDGRSEWRMRGLCARDDGTVVYSVNRGHDLNPIWHFICGSYTSDPFTYIGDIKIRGDTAYARARDDNGLYLLVNGETYGPYEDVNGFCLLRVPCGIIQESPVAYYLARQQDGRTFLFKDGRTVEGPFRSASLDRCSDSTAVLVARLDDGLMYEMPLHFYTHTN